MTCWLNTERSVGLILTVTLFNLLIDKLLGTVKWQFTTPDTQWVCRCKKKTPEKEGSTTKGKLMKCYTF